jgi:LacI family transcriptional regulator
MTSGRVTIRELASRSGVSVGTVSRALNGYPDVNPETRERIVRLATEMDYTPSAAARALVTERSHVAGVFLDTGEGHPDVQHPFFEAVLGGLKDAIGPAGFDLLLFASEQPGNGFGPHSYTKRCRHHRVDGVVLMGVRPDDPEVHRLARSDLPCIGVDLEIEGPNTGCVMSRNDDGMVQAVQHLSELGHSRIATIAGPLAMRPGRDRLRGYREGMEKAGLGYRDDYVVYGDFYVESGIEAAKLLLGLEERPTAIVAASDLMAIGALRAAGDAGLSVPGDLALIGFDDIMLAAHMNPPLSTLRQDMHGIGTAAGEALARHIDEGDEIPPLIELPVELVARGSTIESQGVGMG